MELCTHFRPMNTKPPRQWSRVEVGTGRGHAEQFTGCELSLSKRQHTTHGLVLEWRSQQGTDMLCFFRCLNNLRLMIFDDTKKDT